MACVTRRVEIAPSRAGIYGFVDGFASPGRFEVDETSPRGTGSETVGYG
jgi:hypothetical protein